MREEKESKNAEEVEGTDMMCLADESEEFSACSVDNEAVVGLRYEVDMADDEALKRSRCGMHQIRSRFPQRDSENVWTQRRKGLSINFRSLIRSV